MKILLYLYSGIVGTIVLLTLLGTLVVYLLSTGDVPSFLADLTNSAKEAVKHYALIGAIAGTVLGAAGAVVGFLLKARIRAVILTIKGIIACAAMIYLLAC